LNGKKVVFLQIEKERDEGAIFYLKTIVIMRRPNIVEAIKKGLDALPLDIEVWLYGSEARGDARPDSDIDLLVLFNKPKVTIDDEYKIYDVTTPIEWDCGVAINPMIYSKSQWESRMTPFRLNVINDGIKI
jgi:predicted nucleotidyltransferase